MGVPSSAASELAKSPELRIYVEEQGRAISWGLYGVVSSLCTGKVFECVFVLVLLCWLIQKLGSTCTKLSLSCLTCFFSVSLLCVFFFYLFSNGHGILPIVCLGK